MEILPTGTVIRVGQNESRSISRSAVGLEFKLEKPATWGQHIRSNTVLKDPGGWGYTLGHKLDKEADTVVSLPNGMKNKMMSSVLDKHY